MPQQTTSKMDKMKNQYSAAQHQQWMNQTLPMKVEGGGSGGSGSQDQIDGVVGSGAQKQSNGRKKEGQGGQ